MNATLKMKFWCILLFKKYSPKCVPLFVYELIILFSDIFPLQFIIFFSYTQVYNVLSTLQFNFGEKMWSHKLPKENSAKENKRDYSGIWTPLIFVPIIAPLPANSNI